MFFRSGLTRDTTAARFFPISLLLHLVLLNGLLSDSAASAAEQKYWELSPYRVQLHLAVDDSQRPQPELGEKLVASLKRRIRATLYPLWTTKITLEKGAEKQRLLTQLPYLQDSTALPQASTQTEPDQEETERSQVVHKTIESLTAGCDKQIYVTVRTTPLGIELSSREFDCSTLRWSSVQRRVVRQDWMLPAQCFDLICQTFSPLATIRPVASDDKKDDQEMLLSFRGSDLPQQANLDFLHAPGEVYQPLMVRTNSRGEVKLDSISEIPWTYLTLGEKEADGWHAAVHTGTRRPFGVRRRGRIEHLALAMRKPTGTTRVRFYARHDRSQGLTGYEVFRREPNAEESQPLGLTDSEGAVEIPPGENPVTLLFLRSEGQLLAKVPIVPGAMDTVEVPVADDTARLRAQASLTSLTEQLIDTVAQRNILIARVRARLAEGKVDEAQELYSDLDSLPGRAQFDQQISTAENRKLNNSDDPKVQARIEQLFADTRKLLGRFLSTKQISELQGELNAARREKSG